MNLIRFKKVVLIISCSSSITISAKCQVMDEWFNQKDTQKKYLLQQVAALQVYMEYLKKGYSVAKKGLSNIKNIKEGHLSLDTLFFNSRASINPRIKNLSKVSAMVSLYDQVVQQRKATIMFINSDVDLNNNEVRHITNVTNGMEKYAYNNIEELISIITPAKYSMSDDERVERINQLYDSMQAEVESIRGYNNEIRLLCVSRAEEGQDARFLRSLYAK